MNLIEAECLLPTVFGNFKLYSIANINDPLNPHIVLQNDSPSNKNASNLRIHSECFTSDLLGSVRCDCRDQLHFSLKYLQKKGGILIYLRQEGRGIGLTNKIKAYHLQDQGMDTVEANKALGMKVDNRNYDIVKKILSHFNMPSVNLITNNPSKMKALESFGIKIQKRIPTKITRQENLHYLLTKKEKMGHLFEL